MSAASDKRSEDFLKISGQFKLGALVTEASHPVTARLSEVAREDIAKALDLLFHGVRFRRAAEHPAGFDLAGFLAARRRRGSGAARVQRDGGRGFRADQVGG